MLGVFSAMRRGDVIFGKEGIRRWIKGSPWDRRKVLWAVVLHKKGGKICYVKWNYLQEILKGVNKIDENADNGKKMQHFVIKCCIPLYFTHYISNRTENT